MIVRNLLLSVDCVEQLKFCVHRRPTFKDRASSIGSSPCIGHRRSTFKERASGIDHRACNFLRTSCIDFKTEPLSTFWTSASMGKTRKVVILPLVSKSATKKKRTQLSKTVFPHIYFIDPPC